MQHIQKIYGICIVEDFLLFRFVRYWFEIRFAHLDNVFFSNRINGIDYNLIKRVLRKCATLLYRLYTETIDLLLFVWFFPHSIFPAEVVTIMRRDFYGLGTARVRWNSPGTKIRQWTLVSKPQKNFCFLNLKPQATTKKWDKHF